MSILRHLYDSEHLYFIRTQLNVTQTDAFGTEQSVKKSRVEPGSKAWSADRGIQRAYSYKSGGHWVSGAK